MNEYVTVASIVALGEVALFYMTWEYKSSDVLRPILEVYNDISRGVEDVVCDAGEELSELLEALEDLPNRLPPIARARRRLLRRRINRKLGD